ncbi:MAG: TIGR02710 family CRISPR-associated protein [Candidatus Heimdallarchaeota archaeon]|nr:TIGR02710 family CRISPR-associated protein [Candidatus Heimdallarchaeota archaeon]
MENKKYKTRGRKMKIEKILVIKNSLPILSIPEEPLSATTPDEVLISAFMSGRNNFSREFSEEGILSYQDGNYNVTLLKGDELIIALFSDRHSLKAMPEIIREYILEGIDRDSEKEKIKQLLKERLEMVFPSKIPPLYNKKGLLVTVGTRTTPVWYAISRHAPEFLVCIVSEITKTIALELIDLFGYKLEENAKIFYCDPYDTSSIAEVGIKGMEFFKKNKLSKEEILFNSTGGTKAMTIAIAHLSFSENIPTYYVQSKLAQKSQDDRIYPDQKIELLDNAVETLGVSLEKRAKEAFNDLNFSKARELFEKLQSVIDANKRLIYKGLKFLAEAYYYWDLFDFTRAIQKLNGAIGIIKPNLRDKYGKKYQKVHSKLQKQYKLISQLKGVNLNNIAEVEEEILLILYFELVNNAKRREEEKFDDAIARYYRLLEATAQLLLWKKHKVNVFEERIGLLESWKSLENMDSKVKEEGLLNKIESVLPVRNLSILAHGWIPIREKTIRKFKEIIDPCTQLIQSYFSEKYEQVESMQEILVFIKLPVEEE